MSNTANPDFGAFFSPTPTQDTDLLQQLPFLPRLQELLLLRQVHGLEHATVWVLDEMSKTQNRPTDSDSLGGLSTEQGFYLYGEVNPLHLQKAVPEAQRFITTAIPYNVAIQKISRTTDFWGRPASFIQVSWHEG